MCNNVRCIFPGDIFNVLLNVVDECLNEEIVERNPDVNRLIEISSACLLSFAIIRGDTGKMLRAISAILISKYSLSHSMVVSILIFYEFGAI